MKTKLLIIALLASFNSYGQVYQLFTVPDTVKDKTYKYLILYRESVSSMKIYDGSAGMVNTWETNCAAFETFDKLEEWLNSSYKDRKNINLPVNNIIGIYDMSTARKIKFELREEKQVREKKIEIEKEEWIDRYYKIEQ